ncbi:3-deoxy-D-manno-octulosonic acid transferase [Sinobacterium norvegicum]|uniref:3-deoxy-D-manno-octulosonic acid transferase n=1 Tax=Sinobacterium norvegicum TaxID=1641715 RepID=A0ABN8EL51_9GAMM|nr:lipid IV(A) 3-deoxy-D-manno-octulosonic acid transferase [Sinobacterium norvegicum]CAH0992824.1 3-deoxy-D-manno-octulosonic acid transferase [Sinobacterium norvegicum]
MAGEYCWQINYCKELAVGSFLARILYTGIFYLIQPLVMLRLLWRSLKAPAYRQRMLERYGVYLKKRLNNKPTIWVHAVSVGESIACAPMVRALQQKYPNHSLLVTTTTPTGSEQVYQLFRGSVEHVYAPYDLPTSLSRFLRRYKPQLAIVVETELWPNMVAACSRRNIPVIVANARLSARSAGGYQRFHRITLPMIRRLTCVVAQNAVDGQRFVELGLAPAKLVVSGSVKFDVDLPAALQATAEDLNNLWHAHHSRVIIAASTHAGEDEQILAAFKALQIKHPQLLLVIVPRHPERFNSVASLADQQGFRVLRRSSGIAPTSQTEVIVGDTMGEMLLMMGASDIAIVGGSLVEHGGHNVLEPALWRLPVVTGPHMFNFMQITELLVDAGGLTMLSEQQSLEPVLARLLDDDTLRQQQGEKAYAVVEQNRGALGTLLATIDHQLS